MRRVVTILVLIWAIIPAEAMNGRLSITAPLPETTHAAQTRHAAIECRRSGPAIIVHRGASAFAPENTLEAYAAAMDCGADGCEIDLRRTRDGVLVLSHDETLIRCFESSGIISQLSYSELRDVAPRFAATRAIRNIRVPTFAAVLQLAKQRNMLLHLDIKEPGLESQIIRLLDESDTWDHIVAVNDYNATTILQHPRLKLLAYKAPGLNEGRLDIDPEAIKDALAKPGNMIMVDDPRLAAHLLDRQFKRLKLPENLFSELETERRGLALLHDMKAHSPEELSQLLRSSPTNNDDNGIAQRAFAAQRVGEIGVNTTATRKLLENVVINRGLHTNWVYHGLDGVAAVYALAHLRATESVTTLHEAFFCIDPKLEQIDAPMFTSYPIAWTDCRVKSAIVTAFAQMPCAKSKRALMDYLSLNGTDAHELAPPLHAEVSAALLRQRLSDSELERLVCSTNSSVRGATILGCIDEPSTQHRAALRKNAAWALQLPTAR